MLNTRKVGDISDIFKEGTANRGKAAGDEALTSAVTHVETRATLPALAQTRIGSWLHGK